MSSAEQFGGAPRARPAPAGRALEAHVDDPGLGELVEVEGGDGAGDAERLRRLVPAQPSVALGQQPVQVTSQGLVEDGDPTDPVIEVNRGVHGQESKTE